MKPLQKCEGFFDSGGLKKQAHADVPLRLRRALQSRVEAPLFREPCMQMRGFLDPKPLSFVLKFVLAKRHMAALAVNIV